ncbi:MAG: hypothetical protein ACF8PG_16575 [Maioricimonas sp. JB045]
MHKAFSRPIFVTLVVAAVLGVLDLIAAGLAALLQGSGDATGASGAWIVAQVVAGLLVLDLVAMVVLLALDRLARENSA